MAVTDISEARIKEATGKTWSEWLTLFKSFKADQLTHKDIVKTLSKKTEVDGWWLQMVTVKYEQEIGRREKGQESNGSYTMGVGNVVDGELDDVFAKWLDAVEGKQSFNSESVEDMSNSSSEKWRYWRANFANGTKAVVGLHQQKPGKVGFGIDQQKCITKDQAIEWKTYWRGFVGKTFKGEE